MNENIDNLLKRAVKLSEQLADLAEDDPRRQALEAERAEVRAEAASQALERRHPVSIEAEIAMLQSRLASIEDMRIQPGYNENHLKHTVQDPGAYRYGINRLIDDEHGAEIASISARLAELRAARTDSS